MTELDAEHDYAMFRKLKEEGYTGAALVAWFGPRDAAALELWWQAELAINKIEPDHEADMLNFEERDELARAFPRSEYE